MQCGLQTTSVCMTNHCERASLQPTQPNTYVWEQIDTLMWVQKHTLLWSTTQCLGHCRYSYNYMTEKTWKLPCHCHKWSVCWHWKSFRRANHILILEQIESNSGIFFSIATVKFTHKYLLSGMSQLYSSLLGLSFCLIMLSFTEPTETAQTNLLGEHGGQANNTSEPKPKQLPQWCLYLTVAGGSPWELRWEGRTDPSLWIGTINTEVTFTMLAMLVPATVGQTW